MSTRYLDAAETAQVAHEAVYRAWFCLGGSVEMSTWFDLTGFVQRDARDAVSSRIRGTYQNQRIPTSIPAEYGEFWRCVVDSAVRLQYTEAPSDDS